MGTEDLWMRFQEEGGQMEWKELVPPSKF